MFSHKLLRVLGIATLLNVSQAEAKWIEAIGQATIEHQDLVSARRVAIRDAVQQVTLQAGADISSYQQVTDGAITADNLRVSSNGKVQDINILKEEVKDGVLYLTIQADIVETKSCADAFSNGYQRSAAVTSFYLADPTSANFGGLYQIGQKLPADIARRLGSYQKIKVLDASNFQLYTNPATIPTSVTTLGTLTNAVSAATQLGVQYVISGVIRDLSMGRPDLLKTKSYAEQIKDRMQYQDKRFERRFQLDLYVHDGFSGSMVYNQRYDVSGNWTVPLTEKVGFGSSAFWASDYGNQVDKILEESIKDLHGSLGCQPFMAKVIRTEGKNIYIDAGADSGLRPGDTLNLYRSNTFYDANQTPYTELENVKIVLTLKKVQPFFSKGVVSTETDQLGIQQGDAVIAW
ncbi:hypothetical protein BTE48_08880 [Oceanospirillum multiglobuliferum]|uniref:Flagellar assembly protein T N-terminal domain-containing protein n=2 Tax=Oceanospirillum multiglobuliferum TaxID=64969 RepID=A0A1V4T4F5_9GAMM|nr:hypothetical protein BTE48_08880 [Oceanospirillum multiglobuliferum]